MKNNTLNLFLLFNGILSILAACPSYPAIPSTSIPKDNPLVLTADSPGMIPLNPSLRKLSMTMTVTLDEECPEDGYWELFTLTISPDGNSESTMANLYIECDTFELYGSGAWGSGTLVDEIFEGESRTVNLYFSIDLDAQEFWAEANSADTGGAKGSSGSDIRLLQGLPPIILPPIGGGGGPPGPPGFDETTKLYLCSWKGSDALACTVSRLQLVPTYDGGEIPNHLGDFTPVTQAFYPLSGDLTSIINTEDSAYFGDSASSPTAGSSPSWDESNSYVQITEKTQFLTLPLPPMVENSIIPPSMTVAFWVRVADIPQSSAVLFSLIMDDGSTGFELGVDGDTLEVYGVEMEMSNELYLDDLDTWELISCSFYYFSGDVFVIFSVGASKASGTWGFGSNVPAKLQIGDSTISFIGDISSVRILSPGVSYLTTEDTCSPNTLVEINAGPSALLCTEDASFNPYNSKCYSSCSGGAVTPFEDAPYTLCYSGEEDEVEVEESSGLSAGAIAGIVVGSLASVSMVAAVGYFVKLKFAKVAAKKAAGQAYQMKSPATGTINTTTNMVAP